MDNQVSQKNEIAREQEQEYKALISAAQKAIEENDYFEAAKLYMEAAPLNESSAEVHALGFTGYYILDMYRKAFDEKKVEEALADRDSCNVILMNVAEELPWQTVFMSLKEKYNESACSVAIKEMFFFLEGLMKAVMEKRRSLSDFDIKALSTEELHAKVEEMQEDRIVDEKIYSMCIVYGDVALMLWDSPLIKDAVIEIWKHFLIDNSFGLIVEAREKYRLSSRNCMNFFDPITYKYATREGVEQVFENEIEKLMKENAKTIGEYIHSEIYAKSSLDVSMGTIENWGFHKYDAPSIRTFVLIYPGGTLYREIIGKDTRLFENPLEYYQSKSFPVEIKKEKKEKDFYEYRLTSSLIEKTGLFSKSPSPLAVCYAELAQDYITETYQIPVQISVSYVGKEGGVVFHVQRQ